jgi:integrase/recombinase XerD
MKRRTPKKIAMELTNILKKENPDADYLKKIFRHIREELGVFGGTVRKKKLPELLTEKELKDFYKVVWKSENRCHMIMVKVLLYTGIRNAELSEIKFTDLDLENLKIRINEGKGSKDRYVPIPESFKGELSQYYLAQKENNTTEYLFETSRKGKYSTRWIREIIKRYADEAGIKKRIYPHLLRHQLLTYLAQQGIIDSKIQLLSGHSDRHSLSIYQDLSLKDVEKEYQEAMKKFPI